MLARYARLVFRFRVWFLTFGLLCMVGGGVYASGVYGSLSQGGFTVPGSQSQRADDIVNGRFGGNRDSLVILCSSANLTVGNPVYAAAVRHLAAQVNRRPDVTSLVSFYSSGETRFVSRDRHQTYLLVGLKGNDSQQAATALQLKQTLRSPPLTLQFGGAAAVNAEATTYVKQDLERAERIALPLTAILLIIIFRSLAAATLPLAIGIYGVIGALVIARLVAIATPMSVYVLNLISLLGLGLAIDYSLFIVSRFREELHKPGTEPEEALVRTLTTAGRTVIFSALTVLVALSGLIIFPMDFLRSMGISGAAAVLVALTGTLLFLPSLLAMLEHKVDALHVASLVHPRARGRLHGPGNWARIASFVMRRPKVTVIATLAVLLLAGTPFLGIHFTNPDFRVLPRESDGRMVGEALEHNFTNSDQTPIQVVIQGTNPLVLKAYEKRLGALPSLASVEPPVTSGDYTLINLVPRTDTYAVATKQLVGKVRQVPADGLQVWVGGQTADLVDLLALIRHDGVYALIVILGAMLVLFFLMLGSLVIPLKTILLTTLSLSAAFGTLVWIFQDGNLASFLGITPEAGIDATQPVIIFALAFGLSMDYAVFLFSRVKEHFDEHTDIRKAVAWGVQRTGGIITSAALLLMAVILAFALGRIVIMKEVGIGLLVAVAVDVFIVRLLLVPASMTLLGRHNWWAPKWLKKIQAKIGFHE